MRKKLFTFLLALVASVGLMNAKVTWKSCNISDLEVYGTYQSSYSKEGVTLSANANHIIARWEGYGDESHRGIFFMTDETGGFTFSNTLGKNFTKIEMTLNGPAGWDHANLGNGWLFNWNHGEESLTFTVTWTGKASTVDLLKDESHFSGENVKKIVFYFEGDSEEPDPTYTIALQDGTANADKVTLSATSAEECTTVTVTPNEEYVITAFSATYAVVVGQLGTIYTIDATLDPETDAYSFKMPAADVTIEATIALKPVPEGDIFAGFTATAGSGGFDNEGHANLVDNKFTSADWTKWCTDFDHMSVPTGETGDACWWIDFEASAALNLTGYILTTGNDTGNEHGRNPKNWVLKAKLNADDAWTTIATVTNDVTMKNQSFKDYKFLVDQSGTYQYFRFEVFADQGAGVMQLCELRLIGTVPAPQPTDQEITPNADPLHTDVYYSTFYDSANKYELPAGVEAYIVTTVSGDAMQLQKVAEAGQTIPAGAGVIFKASLTPFTLTPSDADAVSVEGNRLEGSDVSIATLPNCYVLGCESNVVGFYHYTASMLNPHKAYIIYAPNSGSQAPRHLRFVFNGEQTATGVENVQGNVQSTKVIENGVLYIIKNGVKYNAMGQEVK